MSLILTDCGGIVKTDSTPEVFIGRPPFGVRLTMNDFCETVAYVLKNTDLKPDDPRMDLMSIIRKLEISEGYNRGGKRLA